MVAEWPDWVETQKVSGPHMVSRVLRWSGPETGTPVTARPGNASATAATPASLVRLHSHR